MKNRLSAILVLLTCMFVGFTLGFLAGRSTAPSDIIISQLPKQTPQVTLPPATQALPQPSSSPEDSTAPVGTTVPAETESGLININTATLAQLDSLPGIGPVLAQRIIDFRETYGPFTSVGELTLVDGIGEKRLAAIIDLITIE